MSTYQKIYKSEHPKWIYSIFLIPIFFIFYGVINTNYMFASFFWATGMIVISIIVLLIIIKDYEITEISINSGSFFGYFFIKENKFYKMIDIRIIDQATREWIKDNRKTNIINVYWDGYKYSRNGILLIYIDSHYSLKFHVITPIKCTMAHKDIVRKIPIKNKYSDLDKIVKRYQNINRSCLKRKTILDY